ncbi:MAG TPA: hypothetical protein DCS93_01370 [Microscillaceae bacterium]|nr:hypothetical protein [Microscillaceae bacterium]
MAGLVFSNTSSGNPSLYDAPPSGNFYCAFLLPQGATNPGDSITFGDSPQYQGYYLFGLTAPADPNTFVSNAWAYIASVQQPNQAGGIVWFQDINAASYSSQNVQLIYLQANGNEAFTLLSTYQYKFGNEFVTLALNAILGLSITLDTTNNRFLFAGNSFISFSSNYLNSNTKAGNSLEIPLTGAAQAGMRFILGFNYGIDFAAFDTAQKYFYHDQLTQANQEISYPPLQYGSQNVYVGFQASIHPLDLFNTVSINTYFAFLGQNESTPNSTRTDTVLATNYRTDYGLVINFIPNANFSTSNGSANIPGTTTSMLRFSERSPGSSLRWYTEPAGNFPIALDAADKQYLDAQNQVRMVVGLSGTESVSVTPQVDGQNTADQVAYVANQKAFAVQFPIEELENKVGNNMQQVWLDNTGVTSWVNIVKGDVSNAENIYHTQPQGGALFAIGQGTFTSNSGFLGYYTTNSGVLSKASPPATFPMVGYGQTVGIMPPSSKVDINAFEQQILSPSRKYILTQLLIDQLEKHPLEKEEIVQATSPQGFYLEVDQKTAIWKHMRLASNQFIRGDGNLSPVYTLEFNDLGATLQAALQTNQLFLVISFDKDNVLGKFKHLMEIEDWPFNIDVPKTSEPGQYKNVIIFKYCSGTLEDRVQNIQYWTSPDEFNDTSNNGVPNLAMWLDEYIQEGKAKYATDKDADYQKFYEAVTNPHWRGMIALKVDIPLTSFPAELQGLLAGIDLDEFNAHHFGIDLSIVTNQAGNLALQPTSSLFGLIDYEDVVFEAYNSDIEKYQAESPINTSVDYLYKVLLLKVLFFNSRIQNFNSYLALTINTLFGEKVQSDNRENLQILEGTYENHNGVPAYTFNSTDDNVMYLESEVIQNIEITKVNYVTLVPQEDPNSTEDVESRFSFYGYMNFFALKGFDLMSFGNEIGQAPNGRGAAFANMYIDLSFPINTPTTQTFVFDIDQMTFDLGTSYARDLSLYRHFPLQLTGLVYGTREDSPTSQGYLPVVVKELLQREEISRAWYGLSFKLNMGTLGALASSAGWDTTFVASWNVGGKGVSAGLKLPGVNPQAPALSLQGVIRVDMGAIVLEDTNSGKNPEENEVAYLMTIKNIVLKFLSLSFPADANIDFFLSGNPNDNAPPESLAWFARYVKS